MKRHKQQYYCPVCRKLITLRLRLTDRKPRCCDRVMLKVPRDQSGGVRP